MGILHCAAQNNNVNIMNFIVESLESINVNEVEQVYLYNAKTYLTIVWNSVYGYGLCIVCLLWTYFENWNNL